MKDYISNNLTIKGKTLIFDDSYSNIFLSNDSQCFSLESNNGSLNLQSFVDSNELILPAEGTFKLWGELSIEDNEVEINIEEEVSNILEDSTADLTEDSDDQVANISTICSDLKVDSNKHTYLLSIYTVDSKEAFVHIKRVYSGDEEINFFDIYVQEGHLNISVESLKQGSVKEAGIVLFTPQCNIVPFVCNNASGNKAHFKLDLSKIVVENANTFIGNLVFNNNIFPICISNDVIFNANVPSESGIINTLVISSDKELLKIDIDNTIIFNPIITKFKVIEDNIILAGSFNSNLDLNNIDLFELNLNLFNKEGYIPHKFNYNETNFEIIFSKEDLFNLKNLFSKKIKMRFEVNSTERVINKIAKKKVIFSDIANNSINDEESGFTKLDSEDELICKFTTHIKDTSESFADFTLEHTDNKALKLVIGNAIKISEIPYIRARKDAIQVKFRSALQLPKDSFSLEVKTNSKTLKADRIKVIGKKTFIAIFKHSEITSLKGPEVFTLLDELVTSGMDLEITLNNRVYKQTVSDINEMVVFKNISEFISNTKKYKKLCSLAYKKIFLKLPINKKRVLFESFLGRNVSGNPKYIYEYLVKCGLDEEFELVWILNDTSEKIEGKHKVVKRKSLMYYYMMATSGYWIFNARQAKNIKKREGVTYAQTWHGTPLKRLAGHMESVSMGKKTSIKKYKNDFFKDSAKWDYLFAQNDFSKETLSDAFRFDKEIIEGYPANDILYTHNNTNDINNLKQKLGIPCDKKVILYAPTWRDNQFFKAGHYKFTLELELDKMQKELGDEYVVALRTHYLIANAINTTDYNGFVYDFSKGFDIQELYLVSDILITDYSSVMFDFANLQRPMIFFTYDLEDYRDNLRGFYFDFEEIAPGPIALTTDEVIAAISNKNLALDYKDKYEKFYNTFCHIDNGNSAKNAVDVIFRQK